MPNASPAPLRRTNAGKPVVPQTHDWRPTPPPVEPAPDWPLPTLPPDTWQPGGPSSWDPYESARRKAGQIQRRMDRDRQGIRQAIAIREQEQPWSFGSDQVLRSLRRAERSLDEAGEEARRVTEALDGSPYGGSWPRPERRPSRLDPWTVQRVIEDLTGSLRDTDRHLLAARQADGTWSWARDDRLRKLIDTLRKDIQTNIRLAQEIRDSLSESDYPSYPVFPGEPEYPVEPGYPGYPVDPDFPLPRYPEPRYPIDPRYPSDPRPNPRPPRNPIDPGYPEPRYPIDPGYPVDPRPEPPPVRPGRPPGNPQGPRPEPPPVWPDDPPSSGRPNPRPPRR